MENVDQNYHRSYASDENRFSGLPSILRESATQKNRGPSLANKVIVLDPSCGGSDSGICANDTNECEIVFDVAQRLEGRLLALGVSVFLTRGRANAPSEGERIALQMKIRQISLSPSTSTNMKMAKPMELRRITTEVRHMEFTLLWENALPPLFKEKYALVRIY